ncbi:P1 family peptidase [Polymorphobacter fuscus]|uniref:Peptidase T4 n=1 Tax=Sandarakinorhabdus fusca TaxID=1439888 RepID=A0A7C9KMP6_9SPHN|nr:P1 family peptidase [Polymorphobacter fuscus]KAB7645645.1 P1 family peptidase [Polymorphobacter fuscus]MQT17983.1 peptidase T4 [Polymorphobacter fuscus]
MGESFSAVPGLRVGHAADDHVCTGVTLVIPDAPVVMAVDVRGGGPGTRETDALDPSALVERVHGLALAGGSVFGLAAADEAVLCLSAAGAGLDMGAGVPRVPVVPGAILFDLGNGGDKRWGDAPPYRRLAREAFAALGHDDRSGPIGAGRGARAGSRAGGIGNAGGVLTSGHRIGVLIAVNSFGEVYEGAPPDGMVAMPKPARAGRNTCIGAVATDAPLTRAQARRVAMMAHDGLARCIRPIHTPFDGDTIFVLSTAADGASDPVALVEIGTIAADLVAQAVRRAVFGRG